MFVTSEGTGHEVLQQQSAQSRMKTVEVVDLTEKEIWGYLKFSGCDFEGDTSKTKDDVMDIVVNITGGRLLWLKDLVVAIKKQTPMSKLRTTILLAVNQNFVSSGMCDERDDRYDTFWKLARVLLEQSAIPANDVRKLLPGELYATMGQANVFAYHPSSDTITFQSKAHETLAIVMEEKRLKGEEEKRAKSWWFLFNFK